MLDCCLNLLLCPVDVAPVWAVAGEPTYCWAACPRCARAVQKRPLCTVVPSPERILPHTVALGGAVFFRGPTAVGVPRGVDSIAVAHRPLTACGPQDSVEADRLLPPSGASLAPVQ